MNMHTWRPLFSEETIRKFYCDYDMTYSEVANRLGVNRKVVWTLLKHYGIKTRKATKRNQWGENNHAWKGNDAGYQALHLRVEKRRGKDKKCSVCKTSDSSKTYEWANLTGHYEDPQDFTRMCRSCHRKYDNAKRKS